VSPKLTAAPVLACAATCVKTLLRARQSAKLRYEVGYLRMLRRASVA
jgi:hypothetical protein